MPNPLQPAYDLYLDKLQKQIEEVANTKKMLNQLAKEMGLELPFQDVEVEMVRGMSIRLDEFVNKTPPKAVALFLEKRGKAATWSEVAEGLKRGGFEWGKYGTEEEIRLSIVKNTYTFKYVPTNDAFGLKKWYGEVEKPPQTDTGGEGTPKKGGKSAKAKTNAGSAEESGELPLEEKK